MKLAILSTFLIVAAVAALPVVEEKPDSMAVEAPEQPGELQPAGDDLQADATLWGWGRRWGGRRRSYSGWYGGWGGNPFYRRTYYSYPAYYW